MKMIGRGQLSHLSVACNSRPDIPGIRMSAIRHEASRPAVGIEEFLCRLEAECGQPFRFDQVQQCIACRFVVVENRHKAGVLF